MSTSESPELLRARVRDLEQALRQNDHNAMVTFRLTPTLSNVLGLLLALPLVTPEIVQQRLEIATEAKVAMCRLRKHMSKFGVEIHSQRKIGYWLDNETKDKILHLIRQCVTHEVSEPKELAA